jgi:hypothetical protein
MAGSRELLRQPSCIIPGGHADLGYSQLRMNRDSNSPGLPSTLSKSVDVRSRQVNMARDLELRPGLVFPRTPLNRGE